MTDLTHAPTGQETLGGGAQCRPHRSLLSLPLSANQTQDQAESSVQGGSVDAGGTRGRGLGARVGEGQAVGLPAPVFREPLLAARSPATPVVASIIRRDRSGVSRWI